MNAGRKDLILARLHLEAVLGVLPVFFQLDPAARALLPGKSFALRLATTEGLEQVLHFSPEAVRCEKNAGDLPSLTLRFLGNSQLNRLFLRDGLSIPLPLGNPLLLPQLSFFNRIMGLLEKRLKSLEKPAGGPVDGIDLWLQFLVALSSIPAVGSLDPKVSPFLKRCPAGLAEFSIDGTGYAAVVEWTGSEVFVREGRAPGKADARIFFSDMAVLEQALRDELDQMAAVSLGLIRIEGLIPLAEALGIVTDRVSYYLQSP